MTPEEYLLLHVVLQDAVDDAHAMYVEGQRIYGEHYRPARLASLKQNWESAVRALVLVESWRPQ